MGWAIATGALMGAMAWGVHWLAGSLTSPGAVLLELVAALLLAAVVFVVVKLRDALDEYGLGLIGMSVIWWHCGLPYHGEPVTNATWHVRGTRALTETGRARKCYYWPKKQLAWLRVTRSVVVLGGLFGLLEYRTVTEVLLLNAGLLWVWWLGNRFWDWLDELSFDRAYTQPAHLAAHSIADIPITYRAKGWLDISRDRTKLTAHLPVDYAPEELRDKRLVTALAERVGLQEPKPVWRLSGSEPRLIIESAPHAPSTVLLERMLPVMIRLQWHEFALGMGRGKRPEPVIVSLNDDSPHLGMSMGSGAGKTALARLLAAQWAMNGGVVYILNPKRRGYQWAKGLPNVVVAETPEQIFMLLCWLGCDLDRRQDLASEHADWDDRVPDGLLGPRSLVICEEMNLLVSRQRKYWKRNQLLAAIEQFEMQVSLGVLPEDAPSPEDGPLPKDSPALDALDELCHAGRQSEYFCCLIAQRMSAKTVSGDVLENVGIRLLGRYSQRNVNMMAPDLSQELPVSTSHPGRIQVIADGTVQECQVAYDDRAWVYRAMALAGDAFVPGSVPAMCYAQSPRLSQPYGAVGGLHGSPLRTPHDTLQDVGASSGLVSIKAAVARRLTNGLTVEALRTLRRDDPEFPQPARFKDHAFGAHLYNEETLTDYCAAVVQARRERQLEAQRKQGMPV